MQDSSRHCRHYRHYRFRDCQLLAIAVVTTVLLTGCATLSARHANHERVAYHVFNRTAAPQIMMPELVDAMTGVRLYANLQVSHPSRENGRSGSWVSSESGDATPDEAFGMATYDPFGERLPYRPFRLGEFAVAPASEALMLPRPAAGAFQSASAGHRLPTAVLLSWRAPALPGQQRFKGALQGPVRIALRAAMPAEVLERLAQSSEHRLEVAIGASSSRPVIVWRLTNMIDRGVEVLARGSVDAVRLTSGD